MPSRAEELASRSKILMVGMGLILLSWQACSKASANAVPPIPAPDMATRLPAAAARASRRMYIGHCPAESGSISECCIAFCWPEPNSIEKLLHCVPASAPAGQIHPSLWYTMQLQDIGRADSKA